MRRFLICIIIIGLSVGFSYGEVDLPSTVSFQKVYELPDIPKDKIYSKSREWIARNFKSSKAVIEYESKEEGTIIGNGIIKYPASGLSAIAKSDYKVKFTMKEDMKDNKMRVTFENLYIMLPPPPKGFPDFRTIGTSEPPVKSESDIEAIRPVLLSLSDKLADYIVSKGSSDNW